MNRKLHNIKHASITFINTRCALTGLRLKPAPFMEQPIAWANGRYVQPYHYNLKYHRNAVLFNG